VSLLYSKSETIRVADVGAAKEYFHGTSGTPEDFFKSIPRFRLKFMRSGTFRHPTILVVKRL
jgi:hypothetical protein